MELLHGIPIWYLSRLCRMCYKCWLERDGVNTISTGLLAVKGKHYDKIVAKIKWLRKNIQ